MAADLDDDAEADHTGAETNLDHTEPDHTEPDHPNPDHPNPNPDHPNPDRPKPDHTGAETNRDPPGRPRRQHGPGL